MSFSSDVKAELIKNYSKAAHKKTAELSGMIMLLTSGRVDADKPLKLHFDDPEIAGKCFTTLNKTLNIETVFSEDKKGIILEIKDENGIKKIKSIAEPESLKANKDILKGTDSCRAFLRGAFLIGGAVSNPEKNYHFEIRSANKDVCLFLKDVISTFDIQARISKRRDRHIVYVKEAGEVVDMLNVIEAHVALMNFENIKILREMRGNVNRKVNCDTANIEKTIKASMKQIEDINYINDTVGLSTLDEGLVAIAGMRLANPDMPLAELADMMDPPIGKSGANHRMRKISRIAGNLREARETMND